MSRRRRRILLWTLFPLGSVVVVLLVVHVVLLPWIVRNRFSATLRDAGITNAMFRVPSATLWSASIADVKFPGSETRIDRIHVRYGVGGIRRGQLDALRVLGLHVAIRVDEKGGVDLGPLKPMLEAKPQKRPTAGQAPRLGTIPIVRIELVNSELLVIAPDEKIAVPVHGIAVGAERYRYLLDFEMDLGGPVNLSGSLTPSTGVMRMNLAADDADALRLTRLVSTLMPDADFGLQGRVSTRSSFDWDGKQARVTAQFEAKPTSAEPAATSETGPNFQVAQGVFEVDGTFGSKLAGGGSMTLAVRQAAFTERSQSVEAQGLSVRLQLTSLAPVQSEPNQRLRLERLKVGDIELTGGRVEFQVVESKHMQIEHAQFNFMGGELLAQEAQIGSEGASLTLAMKDVELEQLLKQFAQGKASGQGKVSGELQLKLDGPDITFGTGKLSAVPGGSLVIADAEQIAGQITAPASKQTPQEQVRSGVTEALKNFEFTKLSADIRPGGEKSPGLNGHVHIAGRGRTGTKQEIIYDMTVTNLDKLIESVLDLQKAMSARQDGQRKAQ